MISIPAFKEIALAFENTEANPHFDRTAFKVTGKRIFATLHEAGKACNIKLSAVDQSVFCLAAKDAVYPVNGKWGLQGWTTFDLKQVPVDLLKDALLTAYNDVLSRKK